MSHADSTKEEARGGTKYSVQLVHLAQPQLVQFLGKARPEKDGLMFLVGTFEMTQGAFVIPPP